MSQVMPDDTDEKQAGGTRTRFGKGRSGDPSGRPAGSRNATTLAIEKLLKGEGAKAITRVVIDKAKEGDGVALRLVLERIAPVRRGRPVHFKFAAYRQGA